MGRIQICSSLVAIYLFILTSMAQAAMPILYHRPRGDGMAPGLAPAAGSRRSHSLRTHLVVEIRRVLEIVHREMLEASLASHALGHLGVEAERAKSCTAGFGQRR